MGTWFDGAYSHRAKVKKQNQRELSLFLSLSLYINGPLGARSANSSLFLQELSVDLSAAARGWTIRRRKDP